MAVSSYVAFLSYEEGDEIEWGKFKTREHVRKFCESMLVSDVKCWFDGHHPSLQDELAQRQEAMDQCQMFVAFITKKYIRSRVCEDDLNYAYGKNKIVIAVYLEEVSSTLFPVGTVSTMLTVYAKNFDFTSVVDKGDCNWLTEAPFVTLMNLMKQEIRSSGNGSHH